MVSPVRARPSAHLVTPVHVLFMEKKGAPALQFISLLVSCGILFAGLFLTVKLEYQGKCLYRGPWANVTAGPCAQTALANGGQAIVKGADTAAIPDDLILGVTTPKPIQIIKYRGMFSSDLDLSYDAANIDLSEENNILYLVPSGFNSSAENLSIKMSAAGIVELNQEDCKSYFDNSVRFANASLNEAAIVPIGNASACRLSLTEKSAEEEFVYQIYVYLIPDNGKNQTWEITLTLLSTSSPDLVASLKNTIASFKLR